MTFDTKNEACDSVVMGIVENFDGEVDLVVDDEDDDDEDEEEGSPR